MKPLVAELHEFKRREIVEQPGAALKAVELPVGFAVVGPGVIVGDEVRTEGLALVVANEEVALTLVATVFPRTLPALEQKPPNADITE